MRLRDLAASLIGFSLIAVACQVDGQPTAATTTGAPLQPPPTVTAVPAGESGAGQSSNVDFELDGEKIFASVGCAACHGQNAEGTDFAPGLAGHSLAQVKRQARAPIGTMPVFSPDRISNEELQELAEYIAGLDGGHAHARDGVSGEDLLMHHWMALFALEAGDTREASHHVQHIVSGAEGQHLRMMEQSQSLLSEGAVHEAAHIIEQMLAGLDNAEFDQPTMHLRLAASSLKTRDIANAIHQVEHFAETTAEVNHESAQHIIEALMNGDLVEADEEMAMLLGVEIGDADHDDDEEAHDEADGHDGMEGMAAEEEHDDSEAHDEADGHDDMEGMTHEEEHDDYEAHDEANAHDEAEGMTPEEEHDEANGHNEAEGEAEAEEHDDDDGHDH